MISGLPDRPLHQQEIESLTESDAIRFAFPATPESIEELTEFKSGASFHTRAGGEP